MGWLIYKSGLSFKSKTIVLRSVSSGKLSVDKSLSHLISGLFNFTISILTHFYFMMVNINSFFFFKKNSKIVLFFIEINF